MSQRLRRRLRPSTDAPRQARRAIGELLERVCRTDLTPDAVLLASELVTNAVQHAGGPILLTATYLDATLRVEVHDTRPEPPSLRPLTATDETGRGLHLVRLVADQWATTSRPDGKTIWFELR
jgi:anti-sigma regulatory factor (Ser/Thr protein kinase)